jgi:hypothetical protein
MTAKTRVIRMLEKLSVSQELVSSRDIVIRGQ